MKTRHLFGLLVTLALFLCAAPAAYAEEPPNTPDDPDVTLPPVEDPTPNLAEGSSEPSHSDLGYEPVELWNEPFSVSDDSSLSPVVQPSSLWLVETVDSEGEVGGFTSLALDEAGHSHVSYYDAYPHDNLKYARHDGMNWHIETVDSEGDVGRYTSLALDGDGHPHISYYDDYPNGDLKYAWHDGTIWHIETVDSEGDVGEHTSLALDAAGHPHISYSGGSDLKYAWHDGTIWHIETVDSEGGVGEHTSLALDAAGRSHISYSGGGLKYARHDGTSWHIETVDNEYVSGHTSLALDAAGRPHISYYDGTNYNLKYAQHDGTSWHIETVDSGIWVGYHASLALDGAGLPHIGYCGLHDLRYARHDGTNWHIETVDNGEDVGGANSLALDGAGRPHISYFDFPNWDLKYAWRLPFLLDKQVAPSDSLDDIDALTHTLTYSLTFLGDGGDFHLWDPLPDGVGYVPDSITSTLTPPAVYSPTLDAVIWEGALPPLAAQTVNFQVALEITSTRFLTIPRSIVNTAWLTDTESGESATAAATVNVLSPPFFLWYEDVRGINGNHVYNYDPLTYTLGLFSSDLDRSVRLWDPLPPGAHYVPGSLTSILTGTTGTLTPPAIYSPTARAITWEGTLPADTTGVVRYQVTADIDGISDENPSCAWLTNTAWLTATEGNNRSITSTSRILVKNPSSADNWITEVVDSEGDAGGYGYSSLALDGDGFPHISFGDAVDYFTHNDFKYARYDGTNWHIETVDSVSYQGAYPSLTLDEAGHPHISYTDDYTLKYAWHNGTNWHIETVDGGWEVLYTSLALDGDGHPHIGSIDHYWANSYLQYAWYDGTSWHIETVDIEGLAMNGHTSLALDVAGHPHISYCFFDTFGECNGIKHAWHDGTTWHVETVSEEGSRPALALDGNGHPRISYQDADFLKYAWHDGMNWHVETVGREEGSFPSLALDGDGHPHISYKGVYYLKYAWHDGTTWHIETVGEEGGSYPSLALDGAGLARISYGDALGLKYAQRLPFSLDGQATPSDSLEDANALAHTLTYSLTLVGPDLNARLRDPLPDHVRYVPGSITSTLTPPAIYSPTLDAVIWDGVLLTDTVQTVYFQVTPEITSTRFLSEPLSITNVAWMDDLEHGRRVLDTAVVTVEPPPLVFRKQADPASHLRNNDTLTYTLTLVGPVWKARVWDPLPPSVRYVSGSITGTVTPTAVYSPTAHVVVWEGKVPTNTVQTIQFRVTPGITGTGSLSLALPIVNTAWLTATESGMSVSATAIVNGRHIYLPLVLRGN